MPTPSFARRRFRPLVEQLEDRIQPAGLAFTFSIVDPQNQFAPFPLLLNNLQAAGTIFSGFVSGQGRMDVRVIADTNILRATGGTVAVVTVRNEDGFTILENGTIAEARTGIDPNGGEPDIVIRLNPTLYLPIVFFDPSGAARSAAIPADKVDFISVVLHEIGHGLGFQGYRNGDNPGYGTFPSTFKNTFDVQTAFGVGGDPDILYFTGSAATATYGAPVPLTSVGPGAFLTSSNFAHLGNPIGEPGDDLIPDLMNGVVFNFATRYVVSDLDVAILNDLGWDTGPAAPDLDAASDTGIPTDNRTRDTTPTFTGFAPVGATVELFEGDTQLGATTVTDGTWSITTDALAAGAHAVFVRVTVPGGDPVDSPTLTVTIDQTTLIALGQGAGGTATVEVRHASDLSLAFDPQAAQPAEVTRPFPGFTGEVRVAVGDVNGDSTPDVIAAPGRGLPGRVRVFSGADGTQLQGVIGSFLPFGAAWTKGLYVTAGDTNGDGRAEVIVGQAKGGGKVRVFDGATGVRLRNFTPFGTLYTGGVTVAAGDTDADERPGQAEIVVGRQTGKPQVKIFDANGLQLRKLTPFVEMTGGVMVATGNTDGLGQVEVIVALASGSQNLVKVLAATGAERTSTTAFGTTFMGGVRVAAVDRDGDGKSELLVGAGPSAAGPRVRLLDGQTLDELDAFFAFDALFAGGLFVG